MSADSSRSIESYKEDAGRLSSQQFAVKHGKAFLIRALLDGVLHPTPVTDRDAYKGTHKMRKLDQHLGGRLDSPEATYVYPLGALDSVITVGRAKINRVCIDDVSLSAQHAELELGDDGEIYVTDKGSTNGTRVGDTKTPFAEAVRVPFGKSLRFGTVQLTLLRTQQFVDFVRTVTMF